MCFELLPDGGSERDRMGSMRRWNKMDSLLMEHLLWRVFVNRINFIKFLFFSIIIILNFYVFFLRTCEYMFTHAITSYPTKKRGETVFNLRSS